MTRFLWVESDRRQGLIYLWCIDYDVLGSLLWIDVGYATMVLYVVKLPEVAEDHEAGRV